ncbi:MAG TPA: TIGR04283 family arsenosugar biosynthesis glycosyltransferase [Thermoanaerobaculia bacterium]|jgi:rSAM/selenodomain-associated transferase 2|nr:TIGR04283 family arsenosugar biosynthesis glycosyltransferase [Thermoanaerobaculia bacterium]
MRLAIVIPTLNEEPSLRRTLLLAMAAADEVVVSDGGSRDRTVEIARSLGARVVTGPPGRGGQLNRGAAATDADILLFLHADTILPEEAGRAVREAVAGGGAGGAFLIRFDRDGLLYRLGGRVVNLRTRRAFLPLGDQAQFATREAFRELDGFREWPILEDLDFAMRLRRRYDRSRLAVVPDPVVTSARRFARQGPVRTVLTNWLIWLLFLLGISPHRLARLYKNIR